MARLAFIAAAAASAQLDFIADLVAGAGSVEVDAAEDVSINGVLEVVEELVGGAGLDGGLDGVLGSQEGGVVDDVVEQVQGAVDGGAVDGESILEQVVDAVDGLVGSQDVAGMSVVDQVIEVVEDLVGGDGEQEAVGLSVVDEVIEVVQELVGSEDGGVLDAVLGSDGAGGILDEVIGGDLDGLLEQVVGGDVGELLDGAAGSDVDVAGALDGAIGGDIGGVVEDLLGPVLGGLLGDDAGGDLGDIGDLGGLGGILDEVLGGAAGLVGTQQKTSISTESMLSFAELTGQPEVEKAVKDSCLEVCPGLDFFFGEDGDAQDACEALESCPAMESDCTALWFDADVVSVLPLWDAMCSAPVGEETCFDVLADPFPLPADLCDHPLMDVENADCIQQFLESGDGFLPADFRDNWDVCNLVALEDLDQVVQGEDSDEDEELGGCEA